MDATANTGKIAERIRTARGLDGKTQEDVAGALGVSLRTYIRWEQDESKGFMNRLDDIARVVNTSPTELMGSSDAVLAELVAEVRSQREALNEVCNILKKDAAK